LRNLHANFFNNSRKDLNPSDSVFIPIQFGSNGSCSARLDAKKFPLLGGTVRITRVLPAKFTPRQP
jgi:hypothetical protein